MNPKKAKTKSAKMPQTLFMICILTIIAYILYQRGYLPTLAMLSGGEDATLKHVRDIVEVDIVRNNEFIVNEDQLIWVTEDGIKALSHEGEEIWADTHTMKNIAITQTSPYFAISEKMGHTVSIFATEGKKADIKFVNPVVYFSMNQKGDLVVIESTKDGHVVSAYDENGNSLGVKRITYIQDAGYPVTAQMSPNGKMMLVSYLNTNGAHIASNIIAIAMGDGGLEKVDNILYGETYENTLLAEIKFVNHNTWVAIGDNSIHFNTLNGEEIVQIEDVYCNYVSGLEQLKEWQGLKYAVVSSSKPTRLTVHPVEKLIWYSQEGEEVAQEILDDPATYLYGDGKTTIIGQDRRFTAFNRLGKKRWEYTGTKDIQKMLPLSSGQQVIMISKGKAELMQVVK